jgi:pSer/pThr/pTyr-binding forkhead associated (FHA) protein
LKDKSVSRRHAEIRVDAEEIAIRDLGSTNGTRVNGKQISSWRVVEEGDEIRLGDLPLTLELPEH